MSAPTCSTPAKTLEYPTVALLVSGGHTSLLLVRDLTSDVELLGETDRRRGRRSIRQGRAAARPALPRRSRDRPRGDDGDPKAIRFPRGLSRASDMAKNRYDFSFSGLKTAVARWVEQHEAAGADIPVADVAASFREAVVDVLVTKAVAACADYGVPRLLLGGGVIANARLRESRSSAPPPQGSPCASRRCALHRQRGHDRRARRASSSCRVAAPSTLDFGADSTLPVTEIQVAESAAS